VFVLLIFSLFFSKIIGLDSEPVKTHAEIRNCLRHHFERINSFSTFKGSTKVFIPENNLGNEATHMHAMVSDMADVVTYYEKGKNQRPGVNKTLPITDDYQFLLGTKLHEHAVRFYTDYFTTSRRHTQESISGLLQEQMERYHYVYKEGNDDMSKGKYTITGKMGGDKQDDLLIALMMCVYWGRAALRDPRRLY
jgi:hypothetical protein